MRRPFGNSRPLGPFAQMSKTCTQTFVAIFRLQDAENVDLVFDEILDNIQARINSTFEEEFNQTPVKDVTGSNMTSNKVKVNVHTNLDTVSGTMESMMIKEMRTELRRMTGGRATNEEYEFTTQ